MHLVLGDATKAIETLDYLDSDIIVFPKSISEFSPDGINELCRCFQEKENRKDTFYLLISLRADKSSQNRDMLKSKRLYDSITAAGYETSTNSGTFYSFKLKDKKIREIDSIFFHPQAEVDLLQTVNTYCKKYNEFGKNCSEDCVKRLNRWPMLSCRSLQWQLFEFTRR